MTNLCERKLKNNEHSFIKQVTKVRKNVHASFLKSRLELYSRKQNNTKGVEEGENCNLKFKTRDFLQ